MLSFFKTTSFKTASAATLLAILLTLSSGVHADTTSSSGSALASPRSLQEALSTNDRVNILGDKTGKGFALSGGFFSGSATGAEQLSSNFSSNAPNPLHLDHAAELIGDQRVYALLIDGRYDFNYDQTSTSLPVHPYVLGGMGMARYDRTGASDTGSALQGGGMVPLFRLGGGVTYRLGAAWDMSLDYKAGFSGASGDQVFTGRGQQPVDLQTLNMGMHYQF